MSELTTEMPRERAALEAIARNLMLQQQFHSPATFALRFIDAILANGWTPDAPRSATDPVRPSTATLGGRNDGSDLAAPFGYAVVVTLPDDGGSIVQASAVLPKPTAVARAEFFRREHGMQASVVELREVSP